jgi:hypothetical protein
VVHVKATKNKRSKHVIVEENRSEVNFELVERLAEREERNWPAAPRAEKKLRDRARCADRGRPPTAQL